MSDAALLAVPTLQVQTMNYSIPFAIAILALGLGACDRPASATVVVPSSVPGPAGPQGATGDQGSKGSPGYTGAQGESGNTGAQGASGDTGAQGATGEQGSTGRPGEKGKSGSTVVVVPAPPQ